MTERIGIYGGTFDPIHNGHLEVACAVVKNFQLDSLLIVPAARPPHKTHGSISDSYHRYAMAALATLELDRIIVSTIELESPDLPYTFQTLERLRACYGPRSQFFFVLGADSFEEFHAWRHPERVLELANLVIAARPGHAVKRLDGIIDLRGRAGPIEAGPAGSIFLTEYVICPISATEIREKVRRRLSIDGLVPPAVANYIRKYGLYQAEVRHG